MHSCFGESWTGNSHDSAYEVLSDIWQSISWRLLDQWAQAAYQSAASKRGSIDSKSLPGLDTDRIREHAVLNHALPAIAMVTLMVKWPKT